MRIAMMTDIHGNLEPFAQSLDDIKRQKIDGIVNLGDAIGYPWRLPALASGADDRKHHRDGIVPSSFFKRHR